MWGVTLNPGSHHQHKNRGVTRNWSAAPRLINAKTKKQSHYYYYYYIIIIIIIIKNRTLNVNRSYKSARCSACLVNSIHVMWQWTQTSSARSQFTNSVDNALASRGKVHQGMMGYLAFQKLMVLVSADQLPTICTWSAERSWLISW